MAGNRPRKSPVAQDVPRTGYNLPADQIERALLTGDSRGILEDYFGPENYVQLRDLARDAATRSVRGGARVLILPGIMGSRLAKKVLLIEDILWVNPVEIALGRLTALKIDGGQPDYHAAGVMLFAYLKLKLRLRIAGFNADYFPFDWRLGLAGLGAALADALRAEPAQVSLVTHSMGGLVARAMPPGGWEKVARFIMMGVPNYGSFVPVQVIRGTCSIVQMLDKLDPFHSAEQLSSDVFNSFPALYQLLPAPDKFTGLDLYDAAAWPKQGPQPRAALLAAAKPVLGGLAAADARYFLIAGVNQDTVTGLRLAGDEFAYEISPDGDGTVPLAFARLAGIAEKQVYYVEESHGSLPNNGSVEAAVIDLLSSGVTSALPAERPAPRRAGGVVTESEAHATARQRSGAGPLGSSDLRHLLDPLLSPDSRTPAGVSAAPADGGAATGDAGAPFQNLVIGRRRQHRLELALARGSITEVDAPAYVLGIFRDVAPSGAATALDRRLDGAISEFATRRMFDGDVGEIFTIPTTRSKLGADLVLLAGLGAFDRFNADVQQLVAENIIRVLVRSRVDEFATILIGAGSGQSAPAVLQNLLVGFLRGLRDADPRSRFRGITFCESDAARYGEMKSELFRLAGTPLFEDFEVTLDEVAVPPAPEEPGPRAMVAGPEPVYAIARQEGQSDDVLHFRISILGSGLKAAVVSAQQNIENKSLNKLLQKFDRAVGPNSDLQDLGPLGEEFARLVLPAEATSVLESLRDRHLVVVHDAPSSRIPWEILAIDGWCPAVGGGLSRRYLAENLPIATWLEQRRAEPSLKLLLVVDPLGDLRGADDEAASIRQLTASTPAIAVTELQGAAATKAAIVSALRTGAYDIVHYAGHASFAENAPARSGLFCAGEEVLTGADLMGISNLPFVVFFNACEAARIRGAPAKRPPVAPSERVRQSSGVAEALMLGGIANYMSTYWPVGDRAAMTFAETFYKGVLSGSPLGSALLEGRKAVQRLGLRDWADYVLYGSFDFVLKR